MREMHNIVVGRDDADAEKFGERGTGIIGRHYVGEKKDAHLTNPVRIDFARPHIVGIFGKRGTGKCMIGDTLVLTANGFERIEDVFKGVKHDVSEKESPSEELLPVHSDIEVASLDADGTITYRNVSHVYRKNVSEELITIKTRLGREITCTREHPLFVMSDKGPLWKEAKDITERDFVAIPRIIQQDTVRNKSLRLEPEGAEASPTDLKSLQKFDILSSIFDGPMSVNGIMESTAHRGGSVWRDVAALERSGLLTLERNSPLRAKLTEAGRSYIQAHTIGCYVKMGKKQSPIKIPATSSDLAEFIGYALAEGNERSDSQRYLLGFTNHNVRMMERYIALSKSLFGITPSVYKSKSTYAVIHSKGLEQYFKKIGYVTNKKSAEKDIPPFIITRRECAASFLRAYADCEGYVSPKGYIEIATASKFIAHKLAYLLLKFGIVANIKEKLKCASNTKLKMKRKYYSVYILGIVQLRIFEQFVGFSDSKKMQTLRGLKAARSNPNLDIIPFVGHILKSTRISIGMLQDEVHKNGQVTGAYESGKYNPTPQKLKYFIEKFNMRIEDTKIALNTLKDSRTIEDFRKLMSITHIPWKGIIANLDIKKSGEAILGYKKYLNGDGKEKIVDFLITETERRLSAAAKYLSALHYSSSMQVFWDKTAQISKENKSCWVYDLTVPGTHNFIAGGGGIICHNSFTMGVLAEELALLEDDVRKSLSCILIDTMGIFWSMKNINERDTAMYAEWNIKPQRFPVLLLIPEGQAKKFAELGIPFDATFSINPEELTAEDWALTFNLELDSEMGVLLQKALKRAKRQGEYSLEDIALQIKADKSGEQHTKEALISRFAIASEWGVFRKRAERPQAQKPVIQSDFFGNAASGSTKAEHISLSSVTDIVLPGKTTIVDLSMLEEWGVRALVAGLITKKILEARMAARRLEEMEAISGSYERSKMPMAWIMVDEAHQFLPSRGTTPATAPLLQCIKIGREPGVSMVFATQQPNKLHEAAISQCDLVISHRLTSKQDIESLKNIMQTYLKYDLQEYIEALPRVKGAAIILDDNSERIYAVRIRPRMSWHAGGSPSAVKESR